MKKEIRSATLAAGVAAVAAAAPWSAAMAALDGSKNMVCAVMEVVGCVDDAPCLQGRAGSFDLPEFVAIDTKKKVVTGTRESGHTEVSVIKTMEQDGSHLILQGAENSRGWNLAIDTKTGRMSASVVGDAVSFLAFGACTAP